ncbi:DUF3017 domain-containing protein [Streptomyces sp. NPDC014646]|uniref:DUF3017 domain-containing protein n=1 Tax=unclassified Streptomyces TaxID=2593676 RepID=UPI0036F92F38
MGAGRSPARPAVEVDVATADAATAGEGAQGRAASNASNASNEDASGEATASEVVPGGGAPGEATSNDAAPGEDASGAAASNEVASGEGGDAGSGSSRRPPLFTRDTARPEGGGRAAPGDAPAPARQWPLLAVLCVAGLGLLIVALDPFTEAFRVGTILIGASLIGGAVLRLVVPSVGMLAVRSRFTDLVTYGLLGFLIVMLALVAQPKPWLDIPFLEDAVHFTIR